VKGKTLLAAAVATVAALVSVASGLGGSSVTTLNGTVGPGFTISLTQGGHKVSTLKQGTYRLVVSDRSDDHNFVLRGPGTTRSLSSVGATGSRTVLVKLTKGTWTYFCAPHASIMRGSFRVT
jgi:plastocyanin